MDKRLALDHIERVCAAASEPEPPHAELQRAGQWRRWTYGHKSYGGDGPRAWLAYHEAWQEWARKRIAEARAEIERAAYRLETVEADLAAAHRLGNAMQEMHAEARAEAAQLVRERDYLFAACDAIHLYGADTLPGRADGQDDRRWQRAAVLEMTRRARAATGATRDASLAHGTPAPPQGAGDNGTSTGEGHG